MVVLGTECALIAGTLESNVVPLSVVGAVVTEEVEVLEVEEEEAWWEEGRPVGLDAVGPG
jgi:hypothetical protein